MAQSIAHRPFGVTMVMVFGVIGGIINSALGIFVILDRDDPDLLKYSFHSEDQLLAIGLATLAFGLIQLALALALGRGSNGVRVLYAIVAVFNLIGGIWALVALHSEQRYSGAAAVCVSLLVLYLLFNERADEFFEAPKV
jgi:hypothetical protein